MKVVFSGILLHEGGYSELSRGVITCLHKMGVLVGIEAMDSKMSFRCPPHAYTSKEFQEIYDYHAKPKTYKVQPDVLMQMVPPFMMVKPNFPCRNVGITMFETRVPEKWFPAVNQLDLLLLHDNYQDELFKNCTAAKKRWRPWVLAPELSDYDLKLPKPYILNVGVARVHKNQRKLIQAFIAAKERKHIADYWNLVVKTLKEDNEGDEFRDLLVGRSDIFIIPGPISQRAIDVLYHNASLYICPTMCEGLNMPAIKSTMAGKPIILGPHTGHGWIEEIDTDVRMLYCAKVDMTELPNIHPRYREGMMFGYDCSQDELMLALIEKAGHEDRRSTPLWQKKTTEYFGEEECRKSLELALA